MKHRMLKVVSLCEARPAQVKRETKESVLRLFLFQMEIRHEWKVLAYVLNVVRRLDAAVAVSQIMWLFPNSNSVFRGQRCARWAPGHRSVREEIGCGCASPIRCAAPLVLGHPMGQGKVGPPVGWSGCSISAGRGSRRTKLLRVDLHHQLTTDLGMFCPALHMFHPRCSVT